MISMNFSGSKFRLLTPILLLFVVMPGCSNSSDEAFEIDKYFDLMGLVEQEISYYEKNPPSDISKTFNFEGDQETQEESIDKLSDIKAILETAQINKPGYRGVYKINKDFNISRSDTLYSVVENNLKQDETANVQSLKAYYTGSPKNDNLYAILIHKKRENFLYNNNQLIYLTMKRGNLSKIKIQGAQSILFFKKAPFALTIKINQ